MKSIKNQLTSIERLFKDAKSKYNSRIRKELGWSKAMLIQKRKKNSKFSRIEVNALIGIGWEIGNQLLKKLKR